MESDDDTEREGLIEETMEQAKDRLLENPGKASEVLGKLGEIVGWIILLLLFSVLI